MPPAALACRDEPDLLVRLDAQRAGIEDGAAAEREAREAALAEAHAKETRQTEDGAAALRRYASSVLQEDFGLTALARRKPSSPGRPPGPAAATGRSGAS